MIWGRAGFSFQDKMFAFPCCTCRVGLSRFPHRESLIPLDLILHRSALTSSSQNRNLRSCLCQWPAFLLLTGLDTVTLLGCMVWDLSSVSKGPTCATMGSWEAAQAGGFGCVGHLAQEHLACHRALLWNGSHRTQPCSVRAPGCSQAWSKPFLKQMEMNIWGVQVSLLLNCVGSRAWKLWDPALWEQSTHSSWLFFLALGWALFAVGSRKILSLHLN